MTIKLIVGLGNPGKKYIATRHNMGSIYLCTLARHYKQILNKESKFFGYVGNIMLQNNKIILFIPTTFMNYSGIGVSAIAHFYHILPEEILVVHDELDFLPGIARFKFGGTCNGHNGLKNIIFCLNNNSNFYRLRIGIGRPINKNQVISFVLSAPLENEQKDINKIIQKSLYCIEIFVIQNFIKAVNCLHTLC